VTEACWTIRSQFPVKASIVGGILGWKIVFEPMTISYDDYEKLGNEIDRDRVYVGDVNVYDFAWRNGLRGVPPKEINGKMVLPGKSGGSYSYETGKADFSFPDETTCREHASRLADRGLISVEPDCAVTMGDGAVVDDSADEAECAGPRP